jgi:CHASE3 domain sensor protein
LLTGEQEYTGKIYAAKSYFAQDLEQLRRASRRSPTGPSSSTTSRRRTDRFTEMSDEVTALDQAGKQQQAQDMHIGSEHTQSHVLEDALNSFVADSHEQGGSGDRQLREPPAVPDVGRSRRSRA